MNKFRFGAPPQPESYTDWKGYAKALAQWQTTLVQALERHSAETDQPTKESYNITGHTTTTGNIDFSAATAQQVANVLGTLIMTSLNTKGITRKVVTTQ